MFRPAHFSFRREAKWLAIVTLALPVIGMLIVLIIPALARWMGWR